MKFLQLLSFASILVMSTSVNATLINVGYDTFNDPVLNAVNYFSEERPMTSSITNWSLLYEDTDGTGSLSISSTSTAIGNMEINNASLTTNNDGSFHVTGTINFLDLGTSSSIFGDMFVTANWDDFNQVTTFEFLPTVFAGSIHNGLLMSEGPFAGDLLEFQVSSTLLAIVDNPFPSYSPVPVPAAVWLLGSGLIGLFGIARRKKI